VNFAIVLLALAALGASATAAQITASPSLAPTEAAPAPADPASAIASTLFSQLADPGLSAYDYLVIATPGTAVSAPAHSQARIPSVALAASTAIAVSFFIILVWQRRAVRPGHRVFSRRGKRLLRKMAHI
jgi:hypothetical protein